ncbi:cupin-like domain-containing protein [Stenotrophomonas sp. G106K1]|uniref:cupin-like domain-containing protein n=1 Tax=Stenotrophomonas sp. G106K1 TaxID=3134792 RepID=UPI0030F3F681
MNERAIPVLDEREFKAMMARDPEALHRQPCIVTGYIERWPAYSEWQCLDHLRARFGAMAAFAKAPNFVTNTRASLVSVETTFAQYLDYIEHPERVEQIYRDCWLEGDYASFKAQGLPLYCGTLRLVRAATDPLFDLLSPLVPEPLQPLNASLPYYYSLFNHLWLLVSLPGSLTPLHTDNNGTIALVSQLAGRKRATLYAPHDLPHVRNPTVGFMDPLAPDPVDHPTYQQAVRWTGDITPGMTLFIGTQWAHHVTTIEPSISVSFDVVDATNIDRYAASKDWARVFGERVARQPAVAAKLGLKPEALVACDPVIIGRRAMQAVLRASLAEPGLDTAHRQARQRYLAGIPVEPVSRTVDA